MIDVATELEVIHSTRRKAQETERRAADRIRKLASDLANEGIALRDVGALLGVSMQRAHQLVN